MGPGAPEWTTVGHVQWLNWFSPRISYLSPLPEVINLRPCLPRNPFSPKCGQPQIECGNFARNQSSATLDLTHRRYPGESLLVTPQGHWPIMSKIDAHLSFLYIDTPEATHHRGHTMADRRGDTVTNIGMERVRAKMAGLQAQGFDKREKKTRRS